MHDDLNGSVREECIFTVVESQELVLKRGLCSKFIGMDQITILAFVSHNVSSLIDSSALSSYCFYCGYCFVSVIATFFRTSC